MHTIQCHLLIKMSSFKCRKEDCNKSFTNASNRQRHEKKSGHLPQRKQTSIGPEFDELKD